MDTLSGSADKFERWRSREQLDVALALRGQGVGHPNPEGVTGESLVIWHVDTETISDLMGYALVVGAAIPVKHGVHKCDVARCGIAAAQLPMAIVFGV